MTAFTDGLRAWLAQNENARAQPSQPPELTGSGPGRSGCERSEGSARTERAGECSGPGGWPSEAVEVYIERLGVADDLGMDTSPGSVAQDVAGREAARVMAGVPVGAQRTREPDLLDAALAAFAPLGGLRVASSEPRPEPAHDPFHIPGLMSKRPNAIGGSKP